ncbi:MAG: hypothetical protein E6G97_18265 [Alphaproteobacteria bacterium]|nr:MAG: hypothetical protein E6G97_18265 [Alphaproteobacteria bacterium]
MIILNFRHPLTAASLKAITESPHLVARDQEVKNIECQADVTAPFGPQAKAMVDQVGWSGSQWQANRFALVLPVCSSLADAILAEIDGRSGYFPRSLRLKARAYAAAPSMRKMGGAW